MNKNRYKIILLLLSIVTITLSIGLTTSLKNMQKYNDKYDTVSLLENKEVLNLEQMEELTRKTLIICSTDFDSSKSGAISVDKSGNIYTLTYNSSKEAQKAYEKYTNDESVIFCQLDETLNTSTLSKEDMEYWGVECEDCENGSCDIHHIITETIIPNEEDIEWHTNGTSVITHTPNGTLITGPSYDENIANNVMINLESNSSKDTDRKAIIVVLDSGANGDFKYKYNAFDGSQDITDTHGHGTFIVNTIKNNLQGYDYEIIPIKIANDNGIASVSALIKGLEYVQNLNPTVVNISLNSTNNTKDSIIDGYLGKLYENQVITCVSAGNNSDDVINYTPSKFYQAIVVGSCDSEGNRKDFSNFGDSVDYNIVSDSTSEAAALASSMYAKAYMDNVYFTEVAEKSKLVFTPKGSYVKNFWNTNKNDTDSAEYCLWWAYNANSYSTDIAGGTSGVKITSVTAEFASGNTSNGAACSASPCTHSDKHGAKLGVWGTGQKYYYGTGASYTASVYIDGNSAAAASGTVTKVLYIGDSGGPCDGDSDSADWGWFSGDMQSIKFTMTSNNTVAANTTKSLYIKVPGTTGTYSNPGVICQTGDALTKIEKQSLHTCVFNQKNTASTYLKSSATCTAPDYYYYSCTCGKKGTSTFSTKPALGHAWPSTYSYASASGSLNGASSNISNGLRYRNCTRCNVRLESHYLHQTRVYYQNADGSYGSVNYAVNGYAASGSSINGWNRAADAAYKAASTPAYTSTTKPVIKDVYVYRQTYTFDINGFLEGTLFGSLAGTFSNISLQFGSFDVTVNGVSSANDAGDYYTSIRYGSTIVVSDIKALSGYKYNGVYSCSGSSTTSSPLSFTITQNSSLTLTFDDETKPVITFTSSHSDWTNSNVTLTFKATDASTVVKMELLRDGVVVKTVNSGDQSTYTISTDENIEYTVRATDLFGNVQTKSLTVKRDTVKPTVKLDKHAGNWASSHTVNINVSDDASGIIDSGYYFSLESTLNPSYTSEGTKLTYSATQNKDGVWTLYYMAKDKAGNIVKGSTSAYCIDNTLPTIDNYNIEYKGDHVVVNVEAQDNLSKINGWNYNKTGTTPTTWVTSDLIASDNKVNWSFELDEAGTYYIFVKDTKGNVSNSIKIVLTTYTIDYINNYGGNTSVYKIIDKIFVGSEWVTEAAPTNTTYTFKGWNTNNLGTGVNINADTKYQFTEKFITNTLKQSIKSGTNNKLSLYGWWEKGYSLTFNLNGGIQNKSSENIVLNGKFYNNVTSYTFNIVGGLTAEKLNYYDKQVGIFNSYGTVGVNGTNKDIVRKSIDGTTYRLLGWSLDKNAKVPDNNLIVYNNNHNTTYTISSNTTLYAVWEPVLYVQVAGYRNLGTLEDSDITNILKVATQGSTVVSGQTYNGFITTIARPGEAIKYNLQFRGELDRIQVTVDPYISNMYDLQNTVYDDILNKIDISSMEEVIPSEGYDKAYSSLNRLIKNPDKSITRQFYLPQYLGSALAYEASKQQTQYYVDYKFINTNSFYYDYIFGTDEIITVRQYIILAKSSSVNGEVDSVLNDLRTKLKIRLR